jgi:general nucleoside transport system ATP-binding protein
VTIPELDGGSVLALNRITKRFGASAAVDDVSFRLRAGSVHALLGENGAGKTTLMRIGFGLTTPDAGTAFGGTPSRRIGSASDAIAAGIGMVHQHFTHVGAMTVAENVALGGHGRFDARGAADVVVDIGRRTGLALDPRAHAEDLSVGAQQRLEIIKALARRARVLILDEPTAVLAPREISELLAWLRAFANDGNAVVLITHKLREALAIADDITVLRRGRVALSAAAADVTLDSLSAALLGTEAPGALPNDTALSLVESVVPPDRTTTSRGVVAAAHDVTLADDRGVVRIRNASFDVRAGEILGIAAIEGSGQRELLRAFAGRAKTKNGTLETPITPGFVPEDRHRDALVLDFSLTENVALRGAGERRGRVDWRGLRSRATELISRFDVRGGDAGTQARTLSGGNQQKLVLARELDGSPALVVAENPTRGLDIRATADVHERLRAAAVAGAAVVVFSGDLDEVLALSDRVLVIHAGVVRECERDRDVVGRAMLGVA